MGLSGLRDTVDPLPSIGMIAHTESNIHLLTEPLPSPYPRLRIDTQMGESPDEGQPDRHWKSMGDSGANVNSLSPPLCDSPVSIMRCDGWCEYDPFAGRVAVCILSFSCCVGELTIRVG